jgi:hypothetical protein
MTSPRDRTVLTWSGPALVSAKSQHVAWPRSIEVLIGVVAGGIPQLTVFFWWAFQADVSVSMDGARFIGSAIEALFIGGAAGTICRIGWPNAGVASAYRVSNTLVWACSGSFVGYFLGGWTIGAYTPMSHVLIPICQGAIIAFAMAYARCGGMTTN